MSTENEELIAEARIWDKFNRDQLIKVAPNSQVGVMLRLADALEAATNPVTVEGLDLNEIRARIANCKTYNFGMRDADQLAHVDAPAMLEVLDAGSGSLHVDAKHWRQLQEAKARVAELEAAANPVTVNTVEEWMALPEHCVVRIEFISRAGIEEVWHVHRISGAGGAASGNAELSGNWRKTWETYKESHHVLAARMKLLFAPNEAPDA